MKCLYSNFVSLLLIFFIVSSSFAQLPAQKPTTKWRVNVDWPDVKGLKLVLISRFPVTADATKHRFQEYAPGDRRITAEMYFPKDETGRRTHIPTQVLEITNVTVQRIGQTPDNPPRGVYKCFLHVRSIGEGLSDSEKIVGIQAVSIHRLVVGDLEDTLEDHFFIIFD
ncbi:MAG: hypothetical protein HC904_04825 [Blastochloris sp.]|nr:hypothetical protein [Blastochloris sp.]